LSSRWGAAGSAESNRIVSGSTWLLAGKGISMGAGFLFWVIAARSVSLSDMGAAAAATSAVMLCTQFGILGTGAAVIVGIGRRQDPARTLDLAFTLLGLASIVAAGGYLAFAGAFGSRTLFMGQAAAFVAVFVVAAVFGTAIICLDQASVAFGRPHASVARYGLGALLSAGSLLVVSSVREELNGLLVFLCWTSGSVLATLVGALQLWAWMGYRYRPFIQLSAVRGMLRVGLPNQLLTVTERVTPALIPLILGYVVSPELTAHWYPAWMMAWVAFIVPITAGLLQFADGVKNPAGMNHTVRKGIAWSLLVGGAMAVGLAISARTLLGFMGDQYADSSAAALRILCLGLVPFALLQGYNAACRALGRQSEAIALGVCTATTVCLVVAWLAPHGVTAVAWGWLAVMSAAGLLALARLRPLTALPSKVATPAGERREVAHG